VWFVLAASIQCDCRHSADEETSDEQGVSYQLRRHISAGWLSVIWYCHMANIEYAVSLVAAADVLPPTLVVSVGDM